MNARIISEGLGSHGTRILLDGGHELQGVVRAVFTAEVDAYNQIDAHIFCDGIDADGVLTVHATNPETGFSGPVSRIVFADGSEWVAPE